MIEFLKFRLYIESAWELAIRAVFSSLEIHCSAREKTL